MSTPFFSVIVPAYNSSCYIHRLLDSINRQSFKDYELIVVCDSCEDNTEEIAKEYGAITENVRFGADGLTRDRGIELATGDWILFADDDDWFMHGSCFRQIASCIRSADDSVDVVSFGVITKGEGYTKPSPDRICTPKVSHVWASAWKRSAIGDARFGDAVFSSDTYFLRAMKQHIRNYLLLDMPVYYYNLMRDGSQTYLFRKGLLKPSPDAR